VRSLSLLGVGVTLNLCWQGLVGFYKSSLRKPYNITERYGDHSYVLITGGALSIGKQFAIDFAKRNFNLILLDIDEEALNQTKQELNQNYPHVNVITHVVDFA